MPDTLVFLKSLSGLDTGADIKSPEKRQLRERAAAAALFDWEVLILIYLLLYVILLIIDHILSQCVDIFFLFLRCY